MITKARLRGGRLGGWEVGRLGVAIVERGVSFIKKPILVRKCPICKKNCLNTHFVPAYCRSRNLDATSDQTMPSPWGFKLRLELGPAIYIRNKNGLYCIESHFLVTFFLWVVHSYTLADVGK